MSFSDSTSEPTDALREALQRAELYLQAAPAFLVVLDRQERVRLVNAYGCRVLGYREHELLGENWYDLAVARGDRGRLRAAYQDIMNGAAGFSEEVESRLVTCDQQQRTVRWRRTLLRDEHGQIVGTLSAGEDITERRRAERALEHLSSHDQLTGLPNRLALEHRLGAAVANARAHGHGVALLYVDLDDFGVVNDSLGHRGGDEVLREAAHRLSAAAGAGELVARHGGDEFLMLIERLPGAAAEDVALAAGDRLQAAVAQPFRARNGEFEVTAAVGVSLLPGDAKTAEELLAHADSAMHDAKGRRAGPQRYVHAGPSASDRLKLTRRLRRALDDGHVIAHFQPIVEPGSGRCRGWEALARWDDPRRGLVPPAAFIPYAERTGMIEAVGRRMLDLACRQLAAAAPGLWVSVNASARELAAPGYAAEVAAALDAHVVAPASLLIEVTETALVTEPERTTSSLALLRSLGVRLAIDDFGAAYSSLGRLSELPVDVLKVDKRFLRDVPGGRDATRMLGAVLDFAGALGLTAVAEGVETDAQRRALVELNCPLAQGFLLGRPAAAAARRIGVRAALDRAG